MRPSIKFWHKFMALLLAMVLVLPILAACGDNGGDDEKTTTATVTETAKPTITAQPTATTPAATTTKPPATTTTAPTPTKVPNSPAGVLRVGVSTLAQEMHDPLNAKQDTVPLLDMIYETLIGTTWDQLDIGVDGGLATRWEQGADHRGWIIYLRQGMQWDRGYGEITAEDVKFSLDTVIFGNTKNDVRSDQKAMVKDIVVVDRYTVRINTNSAAPTLPYMFSRMGWTGSYIVCKKAVEEMGIEKQALNPVGSGPYRIAGHERGSYFKYEAREDYGGRMPRYKEVYLYLVPEESTRVAMLKRGELNMADVSVAKAVELEKDGFRVIEKKGSTTTAVVLHNLWEGALSKEEVRRALEMAVNRQEISETLFKGKATPISQYSWQVGLTPENAVPMLPYDPQGAKKLLAQAGYPKGFHLTLVVREGGNHAMLSEICAGYWGAIGIDTELKPMDIASWVSAWRAGQFKDTITVTETPNKMFSALLSGATYSSKSPITVLKDPHADELLAALSAAETMEELAQLMVAFYDYGYTKIKGLFHLVDFSNLYALDPKVDTMGGNAGGKTYFGFGGRQLLLYK